MKPNVFLTIVMSVLMLTGCRDETPTAPKTGTPKMTTSKTESTFKYNLEFLKKYNDVIVLSDPNGMGRIAVMPALQGRVMTSTAAGAEGLSFGWINHKLFASGEKQEHIHAFGGEDRFWIGPEGGQFSIFFKKGDPFDFEHWQTPAQIDTIPFDVVSKDENHAVFRKDMELTNYSGITLKLRVDREIRVLDRKAAADLLGAKPASTVNMVTYQSKNMMTNTGDDAWQKETGLLSIWILGMYNPSPTTTVVAPFNTGPEAELGPIVNDVYFGKISADRLVVKDGVIFFKGDGQSRGKIGLSPARAKNILGSYDLANQALTIVQYDKPEGATDYVNSLWEIHDEPYKGDVVNSYNDGPPEPGADQLGPFYELESSSPAVALKPGETITHIHRTFHLQGSEADLNAIAEKTLGVTIKQIKSAFAK